MTRDGPGMIPITEIQHLQKHDDPVVTMTACQEADHTFFGFFFLHRFSCRMQLNLAAEAERKFTKGTKPSVGINVTDCNFTVYLRHRN